MDGRVVFHIDVNSAFLAWEAAYRVKHLGETVDLRSLPSAVGGDRSKRHGIILAKSLPAKKYGIKTGETVVEALKKCPGLVLAAPDYELYEKSSKAMMEILRQYSGAVEQYSIDEAFMDMTGTKRLFGTPVMAANAVKDEIYRTLGFTVNVGISNNKLLAKMAGDFKKPDRVHTLFPEEIPNKLWPLPVGELFFVGSATKKKLNALGIRTVGELAGADPAMLRAVLKKHGEVIWNFANGRDVSGVEPEPPDPKGYGNSTTISFDVTEERTAKMVLLSLSETVAGRLRRDHARAGVVSVGIRYYDLTHASHQCVLPSSTDITKEIYEAACRLFDELWDKTPIRHMGVHTGSISRDCGGRQLTLFDNTDYEKLEKLDRAVDSIRLRFGKDAVQRAAFLQRKDIRHMSGGVGGFSDNGKAGRDHGISVG